MKASDLPKNKACSIRINDKIKDELEALGISVQSLLDKAVNEQFRLTLTKTNKGDKDETVN